MEVFARRILVVGKILRVKMVGARKRLVESRSVDSCRFNVEAELGIRVLF